MNYAGTFCCNLFWGLIMLVIGSSGNFLLPALIGATVDAMTNDDWDKIKYYCLLMLGIVVVSAIASGLRGWLFNSTGYGIARNLKYDLFHNVVRKNIGYFDTVKTGDLLSRMSSDITVVQDGLSTNISMIVRSIFFIVVTIVIMAKISW